MSNFIMNSLVVEVMQRNITKRLGVWAFIVMMALMIPLLIKAPWTVGDFIFGAVALFGAAFLYEITTRNMSNRTHRVVTGLIVAGILVLIWVVAATGLEGIESHPVITGFIEILN